LARERFARAGQSTASQQVSWYCYACR
jgi:hypothetical protein